MLQLQRNLGALLRKTAFRKCLCELVPLSNAHQKFRLRQQRQRFKPDVPRRSPKSREVYVGRNIVLARRPVKILPERVPAEPS